MAGMGSGRNCAPGQCGLAVMAGSGLHGRCVLVLTAKKLQFQGFWSTAGSSEARVEDGQRDRSLSDLT